MDQLLQVLAQLAEDKRADLSDEEIGQLEEELLTAWKQIRDGEFEGVAPDSVKTLGEISHGVASARAEAQVRLEAAAAREAEIAALEAEMLGAEPEAEEIDEAEEPAALEGETVEEPVEAEPLVEAVSADAVAPKPQLARTAPRAHQPLKRAAASYISSGGRDLSSFDEIADIMIERMGDFEDGGQPGREKVRIAKMKTFDYDANPDRILSDDPVVASAQLQKVARESYRPEAWSDTWSAPVTAGAGWCAPTQPTYDFFEIGETQRPVHAALPSFRASRGSVSIPQSPTLSAITTSTSAAAGSTIARLTEQNHKDDVAKPHGTISCPSSDTVIVETITNILEVENLMDKAWPELVRNINRLAMVQWARFTENRILTDIASGSTAVTGNQNLGASRDILMHFSKLAMGVRSRNRIPNAVLRLILPFWVVDMIRDDLMMGMQEDLDFFQIDEAWVVQQFRLRGINASFYIDGATSGGANGQIIGAQPIGKIVDYPDTIVSYFYPEGAWTILENGELSLGVVRDATLNAANRFQTFTESWEKVAKLGYETFVVTSTTCASGASAGTETPTCSGS